MKRLILYEQKIKSDLEDNRVVVAEAIQTILRRENYPKLYEALKELIRTHTIINEKGIHKFIDGFKISADLKKELKEITPYSYR